MDELKSGTATSEELELKLQMLFDRVSDLEDTVSSLHYWRYHGPWSDDHFKVDD